MKTIFFKLIVLLLIFSCASSNREEEHLKNTGKLIKEGHASLYTNGAFKIPMTEVKLISPGPDAWEAAQSLVGIKAKDALLLSLKNAASSYNLVKAGTKKSYKIASGIQDRTGKVSYHIHKETLEDSAYIIKKSAQLPKGMTVASFKLSKKARRGIKNLSKRLDEYAKKYGDKARDDVIYEGKLTSYNLEKSAREYDRDKSKSGERKAKNLRDFGRKFDKDLLDSGKKRDVDLSQRGDKYAKDSSKTGDHIGKQGHLVGEDIERTIYKDAKMINDNTNKKASTHLKYIKNKFVMGYLAVPTNIGRRASYVKKSSIDRFVSIFQKTNKLRKEYSDKFVHIFHKSISNYGESSKESLRKAKEEMQENSSQLGYSLSTIKALSWVTKALFWDAVIKPVGKVTGASLGYTMVNTVAFPTVVVTTGGVATSQLAVQVSWNTVKTAYDLVAPSTIAAVASVYSIFDYTAGKLIAGSIYLSAKPAKMTVKAGGVVGKYGVKAQGVAGKYFYKTYGKYLRASSYVVGKTVKAGAYLISPIAEYSNKLVGKVGKAYGFAASKTVAGSAWVSGQLVRVTTRGGGKIASKSLEYIGVPLVSVGIPAAGATSGVAIGTAGVATGAAYFAAGESLAGISYGFGTILSSSALTVGTSASAGVGATVAAYELGKSVTVPSAYTLGGGIVLSYGSLVQLGAQSILAASDVAYLVLSLEGPRWVIYGVKGKLGDGGDLPGGAVLDLEKMQNKGEEFKYIPVTEDEMKRVIHSVGSPKESK